MLACTLSLNLIAPSISMNNPLTKGDLSTLRIGTFNIAFYRKPNVAEMNALMAKYNIQAAGLQEVDCNTTINNYDVLQKFVDQNTYTWGSFQPAVSRLGGEYGIGLLSTITPVSYDGGSLSTPDGYETRCWQRMVLEVDGQKVSIYNTHLSVESAQIRQDQMHELVNLIKADSNPYKICVGDFNTVYSTEEWYPFLDEFNLANGQDEVWLDTYNGTEGNVTSRVLDNIITTRNIRISNVQMVETSLSDHNLLYADLVLMNHEEPLTNPDIQTLYRLFNPYSNEHFYTATNSERKFLMLNGWIDEGEAWTAPVKGKPVYRLINPSNGSHHWTMDETEKEILVSCGWQEESISWYSDPDKSVPVYRMYNPVNEVHCYTADEAEKQALTDLGWESEGIAWYGK